MGDESIERATGRPVAEWFALLDTEGAVEWTHARIAKFLFEDQGVPGWWAQGVTIRYEQARGLRLPGQKSDGTFSVDRSRRFDGTQPHVLDAAIAALSAEFGPPYAESRESRFLRARWRFDDGSRLIASADPGPTPDRTPLALTHERLPGPEAVEPARERLGALLDLIAL